MRRVGREPADPGGRSDPRRDQPRSRGRSEGGRFSRGPLSIASRSITLRVPPLRERPEDVEPLARIFLAESVRRLGKLRIFASGHPRVSASVPFPGNVPGAAPRDRAGGDPVGGRNPPARRLLPARKSGAGAAARRESPPRELSSQQIEKAISGMRGQPGAGGARARHQPGDALPAAGPAAARARARARRERSEPRESSVRAAAPGATSARLPRASRCWRAIAPRSRAIPRGRSVARDGRRTGHRADRRRSRSRPARTSYPRGREDHARPGDPGRLLQEVDGPVAENEARPGASAPAPVPPACERATGRGGSGTGSRLHRIRSNWRACRNPAARAIFRVSVGIAAPSSSARRNHRAARRFRGFSARRPDADPEGSRPQAACARSCGRRRPSGRRGSRRNPTLLEPRARRSAPRGLRTSVPRRTETPTMPREPVPAGRREPHECRRARRVGGGVERPGRSRVANAASDSAPGIARREPGAVFGEGTDPAARPSRHADRLAEIHEGRRESPGIASSGRSASAAPRDEPAMRSRSGGPAIARARETTRVDVRVRRRGADPEGERRDRGRHVLAETRQPPENGRVRSGAGRRVRARRSRAARGGCARARSNRGPDHSARTLSSDASASDPTSGKRARNGSYRRARRRRSSAGA